jgi:hypothetical protein
MTSGGLPVPGQARQPADNRQQSANLADILERVLDKGIVIACTCSGAVGKILSSSTLSTAREQIVQRRFSGAVIIRLLSVGPA